MEISLPSLTDIRRGSVRVESNPNLCYVKTVDWDQIATEGAGGHFIKDNRNPASCPACSSQRDCALSSGAGQPTYLCWNSHLCQKGTSPPLALYISALTRTQLGWQKFATSHPERPGLARFLSSISLCADKCIHNKTTCGRKPTDCCHKECLGGCTGPLNTNCTACRHVTFQGRCLTKCPHHTYEYMGRRCIDENECRKMSHSGVARSVNYKPFNGKCEANCPPGYTENENDSYSCIPCKESCPKVCPSSIVNSVATAQMLRGCTFINGSLQIQIKGRENVMRELEKNLESIQEIYGYLKIIRSFPIESLNFLKNLTVIHGEVLEQNTYSFFVLDNPNLQDLWDWENRKKRLQIRKGKVFFHFNSKLCLSKIDQLKQYADVNPWNEQDVSPMSNGDRVACNLTTFSIRFGRVSSSSAILIWDNFRRNLSDPRNLLGYVIYYREAPEQNITIYDGRDACGTDAWMTVDVEALDQEDMFFIITYLKPFTQYAIYIRTFTLASSQLGAQSTIHYLRTMPDTPSPPQSISAYSTSPSKIFIQWHSPKRPNGIVTHYQVRVTPEEDSMEFISKRNYCTERKYDCSLKAGRQATLDTCAALLLPDLKKLPAEKEESTKKMGFGSTSNGTEDCCSCKAKHQLDQNEETHEAQIDFEDFVHNSVYVRNPEALYGNNEQNTTSSWPLNWTTTTTSTTTSTALPPVTTTTSTAVPPISTAIETRVYNDTMLVMADLSHFTEYTIEVTACLDENTNTSKQPCSTKAITTVRTLPLGGMDDINPHSIRINTDNATMGMVTLHWQEPLNPNGLVVTYTIEYRKVDSDGHKPIPVCLPWVEYQDKMGYSILGLSAGNYSIILRTTSLAGHSNWTQPIYFTIPQARYDWSTEIIIIITVSLIVIIAIIILVGAIYLRKKNLKWITLGWSFRRYSIPEEIIYASINPEYVSTAYVYKPDEWEVERDKITIIKELGQGSFGMVYEGEARDIVPGQAVVKCAIKTVNDNASYKERLEFLMEASVMKAFNCHHVVKLLGVVSQSPPTLVIMELMANGDLKSYLRSHRPFEHPDLRPPTLKQIFQMAAEIADGMAYLSDKKFVHRDLAARNCMVAEDMTVKIGDFGMTRDIYETDYYRKGGKGLLPVRWMAPESLKDGIFTSHSDVWSYGVVLWEMATLASQPYQGLSNEQVLDYVLAGKHMDMPENCPEKLYSLMCKCWERRASDRPTFGQLIEILLPDVNPHFYEVSFYVKEKMEEAEVTPSTPLRSGSTEDLPTQYFPSSALASPPGSDSGSKVSNGHVPAPRQTPC
ncbi:InR [Cordylochernes scorpioides]|uniref:Tyrosine-protein kinase receptor n=1 Tax=Cordylochernes scorpioides TaxID=51811 RepID=A0ABY6K4U7_9ARAC|nr:InR [Cordylochernes scorpioides]